MKTGMRVSAGTHCTSESTVAAASSTVSAVRAGCASSAHTATAHTDRTIATATSFHH